MRTSALTGLNRHNDNDDDDSGSDIARAKRYCRVCLCFVCHPRCVFASLFNGGAWVFRAWLKVLGLNVCACVFGDIVQRYWMV